MYIADRQAVVCQRCLLVRKESDGLLDGQGVFNAEDAAAAALEAVEMGSGAEGFSEVTGECSDVCALAACHSDRCARESKCRVVRYVYPA